MSIIPNYLALYNLSQIEADILIVTDLTATTGTIYTLNSTTGNITTLNTTTANITTLLTNLWQGTSPTSTMIMGDTITSGNIRIGNYTSPASQTGSIFLYGNTFITGNKSLFINNGDLSLVSSTGIITGNILRGLGATDIISLYSTTTTAEIRIGAGLTDGKLELGTIGTMTGTGGIRCNGDLSIGTTANNKGIACNFFTGLQATDLIRFLQTTTTGNVRICEQQSSGGITIGHLTPASDSGTLTINKNTTLGAGKNLTINSINKIICNTFEGTTATDSINLFTTTTGSPTFPTITLGNSGAGSGSFIINPNTTMNGNLTLASSKTITLNTTGGKVLCNVYTGTTTSSNLTIGESGDTGNLLIYKTITTGNTYSGNNTFSGTNTFSSTLNCNTIRGIAAADNIGLYNTTTGTITLGTTSGGSFTINYNTTLASDKYLEITGDGYLILPTAVANTNAFIRCEKYNTWGAANPVSLFIGTTALITLGNTSGTLQINSTATFANSMTMAVNKNISLSGTGKVVVDTIEGTAAASNILLFSTTSSTITIGNTTSGNLTINPSVVLATGKNLTLSSTGKIVVNTIEGVAVGDITSNSSIILATGKNLTLSSTGKVVSNTIEGVAVGNITSNSSIILATGKTLTTSTTGSILCPTYNSTSATQALTIGGTNTSANITIGAALTSSGFVEIGSGSGGGVISRDDLYLTSGTFPSVVRKTLFCNTINSNSTIGVPEAASLYDTNTTANISMGSALTSGLIIFGNRLASTTGYTLFNHRLRQIRSVSSFDRASYWNVAVGSANNIFQSSILSANAMPPIYGTAQVDGWSVWESDAEAEGSFIGQNGNTTIICNPGDNSAFHWQDEDTMGSASGFKFSVAGVMSTSSDRRLKRDINPIPVGSDLLDKLSLIEYVNYKKKAPTEEKYYKNGKLRQKYQDIHKGLIAQDVKKIFPEVVEKEGEYFMMKYAEVDIYFNIGVQELIKRDKEKQVEIEAQKVLIDDLTTRLARLEQILLNP